MNDQQEPSAGEESGADDKPAGSPKVIKRYTNRKLYDTVESRYVTLDEIAQMIKAGAEVKIIDNRSKEDLTSVTLAQIIFEEEKKRSQMPLGVLREIIRHGGEAVAGFYQEKLGLRLAERLTDVKTRAESLRVDVEQRVRGVTSLLRREDKAETAEPSSTDKAGPPKEPNAMAVEIDKLQRKLEALEKKIEQLGK